MFILSRLTCSQPRLVSLDLRTVAGDYVNEEIFHAPPSLRSGSFSKDDGDGNEDLKKAIGVMRKTTTLFCTVRLPSLHDYDLKMPDRKLYGGRKQWMTNVSFLFLNLSAVPK